MRYPRIPTNIMKVIKYIFLKQKDITFLPWGNMLSNQPVWFLELSMAGLQILQEIKNESEKSG